eukprot:5500673-Prymnesium_polylepis.1
MSNILHTTPQTKDATRTAVTCRFRPKPPRNHPETAGFGHTTCEQRMLSLVLRRRVRPRLYFSLRAVSDTAI